MAPHFKTRKSSAQSAAKLDFSRIRYSAISLQNAEVDISKNNSKSAAYENRTKFPQSGGLEKTGQKREFRDPTGSAQCRGLRAKARVYWGFLWPPTRQRMFGEDRLAERDKPKSNRLWAVDKCRPPVSS